MNPTNASGRIEDFGEKIGGARKDFAKGYIKASDVAQMDSDQLEKFCTKASVWPTPDYTKLFKEGYARIALAHIKAIRDAFPPAPWEKSPAHIARYVEVLLAIRAIEKCKTLGEIHAVMMSPDFAPYYTISPASGNRGKSASTGRVLEELFSTDIRLSYRITSKLFSAITDCAFQDANSTLATYSLRFLRKNPEWPAGEELWEKYARRRGWYVIEPEAPGEQWGIHMGYFGATKGLDDMEFPDKEAARAKLKAMIEGILSERRGEKKKVRIARETAAVGSAITVAEGAVEHDWTEGRDITGEDYLRTFGFRGGEFGNWVDQAERQELLNKGWNAMHDLAFVLDVPTRALSLNGRLAIAFGSRGVNGSAAAHYEPASKCFNLTKPHGAGNWCHEHFHALDHYLFRVLQEQMPAATFPARTDLGSDEYLSFLSARRISRALPNAPAMIEGIPFNVFADLSDAFNEIAQLNESPDAVRARLRGEVDKHKGYLDSWLRYAVTMFSRLTPAPTEAALKQFSNFLTTDSAPLMAAGSADWQLVRFFEKLDQAMPRAKGRADLVTAITWGTNTLRNDYATLARAANDDAAKQLGKAVQSDYRKACLGLDKTRSDPYYSKRGEMAARAFEAYVADKLAEHGRISPFLVTAVDGLAYPQGKERLRINALLGPALHNWAAAMRSHHAQRILLDDTPDASEINTAPLPIHPLAGPTERAARA